MNSGTNKKKAKWSLTSVAAAIAVVAGIATMSEKIVNSTTSIYTKICSLFSHSVEYPVVVDILTSKPSEELMKKFGLEFVSISDNRKSVINDIIEIRPDQDVFRNTTLESSAWRQDIHFGAYFSPEEGLNDAWWTASYPILDIVVSPKDYKSAINISEITFNISQNDLQQDETPYLEVVGEEASAGTLTVINQGWVKIKEARIEYDFAGNPGSMKDVTSYISNINPKQNSYSNSSPLKELVNGEDVASVTLESQAVKTFGETLNEYDEKVRAMLSKKYASPPENDDPYEIVGVFVGVVGRVFAKAESLTGRTLTYTGYFRGIVTLATEGGFGGGYMDVNGKDIVRFKSDLSLLEYSVPVTFRLDEKNSVYRTQIMLASDKTATYSFQFSLKGQGTTLYRSPMIETFIFVPRVSAMPIYERLYSQSK